MILNLSDVLSEQHKAIRESVPIEITSFKSEMGTYNITDTTPLELSVEYAGERKLWIRGKGEITAVAPCDRCLDDVKEKYIHEISLREIRDSMGRREKKNNVTGDKAEDRGFSVLFCRMASVFGEWGVLYKGINDIELVCRNLTKEGKLWR